MRAALDAIVADPTIGDILRDRLTGFRRVRVGRWRIVYRERRREVEIRVVGPRATVYADLIAELERRVREQRPPTAPSTSAAGAGQLSRTRGLTMGVRLRGSRIPRRPQPAPRLTLRTIRKRGDGSRSDTPRQP